MAKFKAEENELSFEELQVMNYVNSVGMLNKDKKLTQEDRAHRSTGHTKVSQAEERLQLKVDYEIDLHGLTVDEARFAILEAISICQSSQYRTLRLIQGGGGPVTGLLKRMVSSELKSQILDLVRDKNNYGSTILKINLDKSLSMASRLKATWRK